MESFITGSHAYGTAKKDSDVDLVIRCSEETKAKLQELSDHGAYPIMFGKLNLICCTSDNQMAAWALALVQCKEIPDISKVKAVHLHDWARGIMNVQILGEHGSGMPDDE